MARFLEIHPTDPQPRLVAQVVAALREDALIAYPTDSGYALGAQLGNREAIGRITRIRQLDAKHHFTLVCHDFAQLGRLVYVDNAEYRAIKASTPGPYTFILRATAEVPRRMAHPKKKTVGVRIPDHPVALAIVEALGEPLLSSTLLLPGADRPMTDGWDVKETLDHELDLVVDAGEVPDTPTTVIDYTTGSAVIDRVGGGDVSRFSAAGR